MGWIKIFYLKHLALDDSQSDLVLSNYIITNEYAH